MREVPCRSCGAPMIWTVTSSGRRMPVDAEPSSLGTFALEEEGDLVLAVLVPNAAQDTSGQLHMSHFATCPQADDWRKS